MAARICRLIGGAGTGKTTELLRLMEMNLDRNADAFEYDGATDPCQIGFVSFTRAARREASERAASLWGMKPVELERDGWFKTLDAVCYRILNAGGELLTNDADGQAWIVEQLGEDLSDGKAAIDGELFNERDSDAAIALRLWDTARNRLGALAAVHAEHAGVSDRTPGLDYCTAVITRYEQAKTLDGRADFIDLRARVSGWRFDPLDGAYKIKPDGETPRIPVWFFDEQQDASPLLDAVCHRLIETANRVYVCGDPFQSIYSFAGSDHRLFRAWPAEKERVMPKSYRCPRPILAMGERILRECSDYWDRKIEPADHAGSVDRFLLDDLISQIDPRESWLLLARTNFHLRKYVAALNAKGIPWHPVDALGGWNAPTRNAALYILWCLEHGESICGSDWKDALDILPSKVEGVELLERGTKKRFEVSGAKADEILPTVSLATLEAGGATDELKSRIADGSWDRLSGDKLGFRAAMHRYGQDAVARPGVRVGTIHSVKGAEADNVVVSQATSMPCLKGRQTQQGWDEEQRVWYVAATRARQRLIILNDEHKVMHRL